VKYLEIDNLDDLAEAICSLRVRGAPAIGVAAALGAALASYQFEGRDTKDLIVHVEKACGVLGSTRPTAVNLFWAIDKIREVLEQEHLEVGPLRQKIIDCALKIAREDELINKKMGELGAELIKDGQNILTHCNAGSLATAYFGTALGVVRSAHLQGKKIHVYVDETRPLLQGARLTAWEMAQEGIPATLITDNMAGFLMAQGKIDLVIVGADRIAANGDVANKIGTYSLAVLADAHSIPFYVAAPISTIDFSLKDGSEIPIEERSREEVTHIGGVKIAADDVDVYNPAFDITPNKYITAIITERGIAKAPFSESLMNLAKEESQI
jgi:methylthioribose-1-phosphate isomerase